MRYQTAADSELEAAGIALSGKNGSTTMDPHVVHHTHASEQATWRLPLMRR